MELLLCGHCRNVGNISDKTLMCVCVCREIVSFAAGENAALRAHP